MNKYYTLLIKHEITNKWSIEFGDEDKDCVQWEYQDTFKNEDSVLAHKIICTDMSQKVINEYVDNLNKREV